MLQHFSSEQNTWVYLSFKNFLFSKHMTKLIQKLPSLCLLWSVNDPESMKLRNFISNSYKWKKLFLFLLFHCCFLLCHYYFFENYRVRAFFFQLSFLMAQFFNHDKKIGCWWQIYFFITVFFFAIIFLLLEIFVVYVHLTHNSYWLGLHILEI